MARSASRAAGPRAARRRAQRVGRDGGEGEEAAGGAEDGRMQHVHVALRAAEQLLGAAAHLEPPRVKVDVARPESIACQTHDMVREWWTT